VAIGAGAEMRSESVEPAGASPSAPSDDSYTICPAQVPDVEIAARTVDNAALRADLPSAAPSKSHEP
jgi:hypothetical protein